MKSDENKRYRLHLLLISLDEANTCLMQQVCIGVSLNDPQWLQAAQQLTSSYEKLKLELFS